MAPHYRYDELGPSDDGEALALQRLVYPTHPLYRTPERAATYWRWRYRHEDAAVADETVLGAWDEDGALVGLRPCTLLSGVVGRAAARIGLLSAVVTHPDHRGRGVFRSLLDAAEARYQAADAAMALTFPNQASYPIYPRRAGWADQGAIPQLAAPGLPGMAWAAVRRLAGRSTGVTELARFDAQVDGLWRRVCAGLGFGVTRCADYLNWRYSDHPLFTYHKLALWARSGELRGYAVCRALAERGAAWRRIGLIMDLVWDPADPPALLLLALGCQERLMRDGAVVAHLLANPLSTRDQALLGLLGFVAVPDRVRPSLRLVTRHYSNAPSSLRPDVAWLLRWGDTDSA